MRIRLLGTAAGGGVPQWNCSCPVCREARSGTGKVLARTQSSVAITADDERWFLLNASPDIRAQIESFERLHPAKSASRNSPIQSVLLTNADLDHTLGLFLMREGEPLQIHATHSVRKSLLEGIALDSALAAFCGIKWIAPRETPAPLMYRDDSPSGMSYQAIPLNGRAPRFARKDVPAMDNVVGYRFVDQQTHGRLLFLPDVAGIDHNLETMLTESDLILFDGTFWSEDEMISRVAGTLTASEMGHMPISGPNGSLQVLKRLDAKLKVYIHINNTNPVLLEDSEERAGALAAGCTIGSDGMEFQI